MIRLSSVAALAMAGLALSCHRNAPSAGSADAADAGPSAATVTNAVPAGAAAAVHHADMVSHASGAYDGGAVSVSAAGAVDGDALRAKNRARLAVTTPVTVLHGGTPLDLGMRLCNAVVPLRPPATPVLLKPNLGGFDWFKDPAKNGGDDGLKGRITDPEFVRGVIRCLKARGHTRITVAEGWGATHKDWERLIKVSGYEQMTREEQVPLVAMDDDGVFDVEGDTPGKPIAIKGMEHSGVPTLLMPKILADTLREGLFLSLPKIKAHRFGVFSMAVKGMQGTVMLSDAAPAFRQKSRMHRELNHWLSTRGKPNEDRAAYVQALETFAERMSDVLEIEAPDAVLAEGAPAMQGDGFEKLWPVPDTFAIGGTNAIEVDRVGAELLGLWNNADLARELGGHATSPLLEVAARRFGIDVTSPPLLGDGAALVSVKRPVHFVAMASFTLGGGGTEVEPRESRPTVHAVDLGSRTITLDGRADDAVWASAPPATFDTDYAGHPTETATSARFAWSKDALYALFELKNTDLDSDTTQPTDVDRPQLYNEDCVEFFFTPDPAVRSHYYEIELGPFGHFLDIDVDREAKTSDVAWSSGPTIATTRDPAAHTATIEARFTSPDIVRALKPGALPLGIFRTEGKKPRQYLAWSPPRTKSPNFHVPEAFGTLILDR
jgi:uncharacterized protein (DUF362 family)